MATEAEAPWVQVEKGMLSRVLYPNPVCLLTVRNPETDERNVMTITWLTPINNQGGFICSMNRNRHSAQFVNRPGAHFVLNIPVQGMEELVLSIGGCSGASVDKFSEFGIDTCNPGDTVYTSDHVEETKAKKQKLSKQEISLRAIQDAASTCIAVRGCVAHVLSRVERVEEDDGHWILRCTQLAAWCRENYWDGKNFIPQQRSLPPYLTFLGSKVFGYVQSE
ncbi:hypothetical protein Poli38472_009445 [Pythium oligandrum]|uniref:Flavin reductase like domain-containing protein n=1 Tax=Pythium oligandrum TaxID=41045 RepID=A0A8K1FJM0_PYTOL|nr:hypothetical protein Poli38472_009445 [Pythium oligandrum]|eukprot:TMW61952.1 hypothetical protein Poli38472_009445 [Pythium oligandrum]